MATLLEYSPPPSPTQAGRRRQWPWLGFWLPMLVIPFVHFTCDASPVGIVMEWASIRGWGKFDKLATVILAGGLVAGVPIYLWRLRLLWRRPIGQIERTAAYVIAAGVAAAYLLVVCLCIHEGDLDGLAWTTIGVSAAFLAAGTWVLWFRRSARGTVEHAIATMLVPYIANATFCVIAFYDEPQLGWYLTLIMTPIAAFEVILFAIAGGHGRVAVVKAQTESPASAQTPGPMLVSTMPDEITPPNPAPP